MEVRIAGQTGLMHSRLLLTQHFFAVAAVFMLRCSLRRGRGHSMLPTVMDFNRSIRRTKFEFTQPQGNPDLCRRRYYPCRRTLCAPQFCSAHHCCSQVMKASTLSNRLAVRGMAKKYPYDESSTSERRTNCPEAISCATSSSFNAMP